jgi:hypothetical protein
MEKDGAVLAGPIHPALGSLVLSSIFYDHTIKLLDKISPDAKELRFGLSERDISNFHGLNNMNISAIKKLYPHTKIIVRSFAEQKRGAISVNTDSVESFTIEIPGII